MGLFKSQSAADDQTCRDYLAGAPPGPRTTALAASCVVQISETPLATSEQFGRLLTVAELLPASELVGKIMVQDRDLSAWIARKSVVQIKSILGSSLMSGDFARDFDTAFASVGLEAPGGGEIRVAPRAVRPPQTDELQAGGAVGLGLTFVGLLNVIVAAPGNRQTSSGWAAYEDLYTDARREDAETMGYDVTAWVSVLIGRLLNTGRISGEIPLFAEAYRRTPPMRDPGWYPNPGKTGEISDGIAQFQRFWDDGWTERVRIRDGRKWKEHLLTLHAPPGD